MPPETIDIFSSSKRRQQSAQGPRRTVSDALVEQGEASYSARASDAADAGESSAGQSLPPMFASALHTLSTSNGRLGDQRGAAAEAALAEVMGSIGESAEDEAADESASGEGDERSDEDAASSSMAAVVDDVLGGLIRDVWQDAEVADALEQLQPAAMLTFRELKQQASSGSSYQDVDATRQQQDIAESSESDNPGVSDTPATEEDMDPATLLQQLELRAFSDYVLDNAIMGLVQEGTIQQQVKINS